jgi:hypothetical protein
LLEPTPFGMMHISLEQPNTFAALAKARTVAIYLVVDKLTHRRI